MTKVDIISGFLGAGKTTFIKELISKVYKDEKIVLIENEFGEIGIDSRFMQDCGIEVTEMNSGCICCTLVGDFARSLKQVTDTYHPDKIIIEPSGVGKLSDVAKAVADMAEEAHVEIGNLITVADGKKAKMYMKNFGEFYNNQIEHADTIVVSRTQFMDEKKLKECVELIREKNSEAAVITTSWEDLSGDMIEAALEKSRDIKKEMIEEHEEHHHEEHHHHHDHDEHKHHHEHDHGCCCGHDHEEHHNHDHEEECHCHAHEHHHEHHHADEVFASWGIETVHRFSKAELEDTLKLLSMTQDLGTVLRAKGIVQCDDGGWMEFDMVPEETEIRECGADYIGRVCVIGTELKEEDLNKIFG